MTKSIEDIMRQMEVQRVAEQQRRIAEEKSLNEQRERQRQDHLQKMRMFEALNTINPSAAAAAAGGRRDCSINNYVEDDFICDYFE